METHVNEKYITFSIGSGVSDIMEQQQQSQSQQEHNVIASHGIVCDTTVECNIDNGNNLTAADNTNDINSDISGGQVAVEILTEQRDDDDNTVVYPIYVKQEDQQQYTSADDESMAVEALRQLGGMYPYFEDKKINCPNCTNVFTQTQMHKHQQSCIPDKLTCTTCNETFERKIDLNNHMVCHQVGRPHACRTCGNLFRSKVNLQAHMSQVHQIGKSHKCTICGADFQRPSSLSNHMKIHTYVAGRAIASQTTTTTTTTNLNHQTSESLKKWPDTDNCDTQTQLIAALPSSSIQTVQSYDVTEVQWSVPSYTFQSDQTNSTIANHNEKMDTLQGFAVMPNGEVTQFEYTQQNAIINQNLTQDYDLSISSFENSNELVKAEIIPYATKDIKSQSNNELDVNFSRVSSLANNDKINISKIWAMPIECEYCDKQFQDVNHLASHQTSCAKKLMQNNIEHGVTNSKWGKHSCNECGKKFTTKQKMFRHQWIHRKKTHSCEVCGSQFEKQCQLDTHRLSAHPGDSPFTCSECGKSFVSRQGLWEHGRTHAGSPAHFHCDTCSKTFSSRQGYLIHHRTHTGERPYGCKFCWKAFRDGGTLRKHERIHTGERPHVCPLCSRAFNQKVVLREHVRWVHAASKNESNIVGPPYSCPLCGASNQDRDELCAHIVKHSDKMIAEAKAKTNNITKAKPIRNKRTKITSGLNQKPAKLIARNIQNDDLISIGDESIGDKNLEGHVINTKQGETLLLVTTDSHSIITTSDDEKTNVQTYECHKAESLNLIAIGKRDDTTILLPADQQTIIHTITNRNNDDNVNTLYIPTSDQTETFHLITTDGKQNNTLHLITKQNEPFMAIQRDSQTNDITSSDIELIDNTQLNTIDINMKDVVRQVENCQNNSTIESETIQVIHYQNDSDIDDYHNHDNNKDNNYIVNNDNGNHDHDYGHSENQNDGDDDDDDDDKELICEICGDNFSDKTILMEHVKIHI